jgi:DNA-directed RNA polymerase specialized sigma24 family protein
MTNAGGDDGTIEARSARAAPLDALLERLAADGDVAPAYARLHLRLTTFFRLRFPAEAESLADEVMDRLARRLGGGTTVLSLAGYALGIARLVAMEAGARQRKERDAARDAVMELELSRPEAEFDPAIPALRSCLGGLDPESAALMLEYYGADSGAARIAGRQALAERLGLSLNALRNRALRLRIGLEQCVRERLQAEIPLPGRRGDEMPNSDTNDIEASSLHE